MKRWMTALCFLGLLVATPAFAGTLEALDGMLDSAEKILGAADRTRPSASSGISYAEPQGFTATVNGDDYYLTIYKDRVHTVYYVGDGEGALLFKITQRTPTSFSATCVADVSYDKWNKKHPKGTMTGTLSGDALTVVFSSPDVNVSGSGKKRMTVKRVNEDVSEFIQSRKYLFSRPLK